jgi:predicted Zn-dependent protease
LDRATEYFVAAVQGGSASSAMWRDLAGVLDQSGRGDDAVTALETALRVDPSDGETWFMLGDLAARCGHAAIVREVAGILITLSPDDPRTARLQAEASKPAA